MQNPPTNQIRWWTPVILFPASVVAGIAFGAMTNAVNGFVSPDYFAAVMRWTGPNTALWQWSIRQGIFEGSICGCVFGFVLSISVAASSLLRCPLRLAAAFLAKAFVIVLGCWLIGGLVGVALFQIIPSFWGSLFIAISPGVNEQQFAWVGGSIQGAYFGSLIALLWCGIGFHLRWKKLVRSSRLPGFEITKAEAQDAALMAGLASPLIETDAAHWRAKLRRYDERHGLDGSH